ncbi:alpha-N-acetylgalactosaminide alpha-2,6-sialyltransferase 2 [Syngnathus scovelli]|uniref:alpha-N-acetylgalactosaminide alpha-2,6-sialyltransferase 2 n=1 Tax=Syngnathus scovelli TaxID=161590 RepID=UPI00210FE93A|nr:alpha-N-acetylgalactosaminide alpha-2,6-sialyltransferase 2 [Syngnathus scovelli]
MSFRKSSIFAWLFVTSFGIVFFIYFQENLALYKLPFSWNFKAIISKQDYEENTTRGMTLNVTGPSESLPVTEVEQETENASTPGIDPETPIPILYKTNFSKLPIWDFEDVYNQDAAPINTVCPQSLRNSMDESFKKAFLPRIRLFLHKNNLNMSEWNRLSHFNIPFGFMDFSYNDIMPLVKLIPVPKEPFLSPKAGGDGCIRCAVVGNGGILNGSNMGKEIDAHDYIFRMNGAVTEGCEDDVGNKTSVYLHTGHSITAPLYLFKKYGYKSAPHDEGIKYVMLTESKRDFQWLQGLLRGEKVQLGQFKNNEPRKYYSGQYNESRFYVLHPDFSRYLRNRFLKSPFLNKTFWHIVRPTNGAFALFLALHTCDIVDAYGFITKDYTNYPSYYFQKHEKIRMILYINHDYHLEMKTWENLHNSKIMRLYQRTEKEPHQKT